MRGREPPKTLVVAAWGYPPSWRELSYSVRIEHDGFLSYLRNAGSGPPPNHSFRGRCSTAAVKDYVKSAGINADALILGLDTVADPSSAGDGPSLRKEALSRYRGWAEEFGFDPTSTDVAVLPGIGAYFGWKFLGRIDYLFNKAYHEVLKTLTEGRYAYIVADLTHGINFQTVATLYAVVAASITAGMEGRVVLVNSEPAPKTAGRHRAARAGDPPAESPAGEPVINVLDVSRLQNAIRFLRLLNMVTQLSPPTDAWDLVSEAGSTGNDLLRRSLRFATLLSNNLVTLTYPKAYCVSGEGGERPLAAVTNPCSDLRDAVVEVPEYVPELDRGGKRVTYDGPDLGKTLNTALNRLIGRLCSSLLRGGGEKDLLRYLNNAASALGRAGHTHSKLIVSRLRKELTDVTLFTRKCLEGGLRDNALCDRLKGLVRSEEGGHVAVEAAALKMLYESKREVTAALSGRGMREGGAGSGVGGLGGSAGPVSVDERLLRNACAHAGFELDVVRQVVLDLRSGRVVKVTYVDCGTMERVVKEVTREGGR